MIFNLMTSAKVLFPKKALSRGTGGWDLDVSFWGDTVEPTVLAPGDPAGAALLLRVGFAYRLTAVASRRLADHVGTLLSVTADLGPFPIAHCLAPGLPLLVLLLWREKKIRGMAGGNQHLLSIQTQQKPLCAHARMGHMNPWEGPGPCDQAPGCLGAGAGWW